VCAAALLDDGRMVSVPPVVRSKAVAWGQEAWVRGLPGLLAELCAEWSLQVGRVFDDATEALVVEATGPDGTAAVLKLQVPGRADAVRHEITALQLADGDGCARLLRAELARGALLVERLGPSLHRLGLPTDERHEILCATARRVWRQAPGCGLPTGAEKARWLADWVERAWEEVGRPCSEQAVEHALACAARRGAAHDDERSVLVHGDVHEWNALATAGGFKLVDPDGLLAEPEYDLGIIMREDPLDLMIGDPRDRARWLARRTGLSPAAIWEWGVVERVSTGLLAAQIELQPIGRQMLAAADRIAADAPALD